MDLGKLATDAAKGAAAGSIVPGVGTALGAVGGVALDLAPEIGRWLFGDDGARTAEAVGQAVQQVTGTDDASQQIAALADPAAAGALRVQLAQIAAARQAAADTAAQAALAATLSDVASARAQTVSLASTKSAIAYGAPVVSVVVLITFGLVMYLALTRSVPAGSEPIINVLLGTLGAMATSVVSYWVGSSAGSARKDERLQQAGL